ncbi:MAG: hypothetical protein JNL47_10010 [Bacteroidia bacterium]|nr:hypothetical protein [Bacteroidia bacterium]
MNQWRRLVLAAFCAILLVLSFLKASMAPITWDEAFTCIEFISTGKLYPGAGGGMAANNHLLNTWLSYTFTRIFGINEINLRLGSILFFGVYLTATSWFALRAKNFTVSFSVFALLSFNPYLFDFFCLSRGYGIAHACLLTSVVCIYRYNLSGEAKWLNRMLGAALAGMLAGAMLLPAFTLLYVTVFLLVPMVNDLRYGKLKWTTALRNSLKRTPLFIHMIFISALIVGVAYFILLQNFNAFLFGGKNGVMQDMLLSMIVNSAYHSGNSVLLYSLSATILALILFLIIRILKNIRLYSTSAEGKTAIVLLLTISGIIFSHGILFILFSTPLPAERTALYLYILAVSIISLTLMAEKRTSLFQNLAYVMTGFLMMIHFISSYNLKTFHDWRADADAPLMIRDLSKVILSNKEKPYSSLSSLELELPLKFYIEKNQELKNRITIERINIPLNTADIYFLEKNESRISDSLEKEKNLIKITYPQGGTLFYSSLIGK